MPHTALLVTLPVKPFHGIVTQVSEFVSVLLDLGFGEGRIIRLGETECSMFRLLFANDPRPVLRVSPGIPQLQEFEHHVIVQRIAPRADYAE